MISIVEIVVDAIVHRMQRGEAFSPDELDLLLRLSSKHIDQITEQLSDEQVLAFSGLLWRRREELAGPLKTAFSAHGSDTETSY